MHSLHSAIRDIRDQTCFPAESAALSEMSRLRPTRKIYTVADYLAIPEGGPRYELLEGELVEMFPEVAETKLPAGIRAGKRKYTVEDYLAIPDEYPRYELLEGELVEMVSPTSRHQIVSRRLFKILDAYCDAKDLGEVFYAPLDVLLARQVVVQPDILFIVKARTAKLIGERITGAPDLVIEILSPTSSTRDLNQKRKLYARYGVPEYWIVDPDDQTIEVQRLQGKVLSTLGIYEKGKKLTSPTFKGLAVDIGRVFAD